MSERHSLNNIQWNFSKPASTETKKYGRFRGMADFVRLRLRRNVWEGLKKSADIQGGPVFWGSGLEKFHCTINQSYCMVNWSVWSIMLYCQLCCMVCYIVWLVMLLSIVLYGLCCMVNWSVWHQVRCMNSYVVLWSNRHAECS
jgi:hypothetical protein